MDVWRRIFKLQYSDRYIGLLQRQHQARTIAAAAMQQYPYPTQCCKVCCILHSKILFINYLPIFFLCGMSWRIRQWGRKCARMARYCDKPLRCRFFMTTMRICQNIVQGLLFRAEIWAQAYSKKKSFWKFLKLIFGISDLDIEALIWLAITLLPSEKFQTLWCDEILWYWVSQ